MMDVFDASERHGYAGLRRDPNDVRGNCEICGERMDDHLVLQRETREPDGEYAVRVEPIGWGCPAKNPSPVVHSEALVPATKSSADSKSRDRRRRRDAMQMAIQLCMSSDVASIVELARAIERYIEEGV
jgi:hypothetical protein